MSKFRLQNVLDYRQRLEDQAQQKLAESLAHRQRLQQQREAHRSELDRLGQVMQQRQQEGISVNDLMLYQTRVDHQAEVLNGVELLLIDAEHQVEECRKEVLTASQDRESMDKLKEKDLKKQAYKEKQRETSQLDEVGARGRTDHD